MAAHSSTYTSAEDALVTTAAKAAAKTFATYQHDATLAAAKVMPPPVLKGDFVDQFNRSNT